VVRAPRVAHGLVYFGVGGSLYALEASTGAVRWQAATGGQGSASPAIASGVVYFSSHTGVISDAGLFSALDASTGAVRWQDQMSVSEDASPVVANGLVYVGAGGSMVALDASTGAMRWQFHSSDRYNPYFAFSTPVVANGVVYADSEGDQSVYALDATTGAVRWRFTHPLSDNEFPEAPAVEQGLVYVVSARNQVFGSAHSSIDALDASTGAVRWRMHDSTHAYSAPAVADDVVYVGSTAGSVTALDATTGAVRWNSLTGAQADALPAVANGVVYVAYYDGSVYALNATSGAQRWRFQTDGAQGMAPSPVVADGAVYVSSSQYLYALNA
jgi:outer membrane protein assembly factor BamB